MSLAPLLVALLVAGAPDPAAALFARHQCQRCHEGTGLPAPALAQACVGCHRRIIDGTLDAPRKLLDGWNRNLVSLRQAPSLAGVSARLRRDWVRAFLLAPSDVRPALAATMPRLALTPEEADALARRLVPEDDRGGAAPAGDVVRGAGLYARFRCGTCHAFTGADVEAVARPGVVARGNGERAPPDPIALAPDLALGRARLRPARVAAFIRDPRAAVADALMPTTPMSPADAEDLAAFVLRVPLRSAPPPHPSAPLPLLGRRVRFAEVQSRVFNRTCRHCHASPDFAFDGDGARAPSSNTGLGVVRFGLNHYRFDAPPQLSVVPRGAWVVVIVDGSRSFDEDDRRAGLVFDRRWSRPTPSSRRKRLPPRPVASWSSPICARAWRCGRPI